MKIGFTGTRAGMSPAQRSQLQYVLAVLRYADRMAGRETVFKDGDCETGADRDARALAASLGCTSEPEPPAARTAAALLARDSAIAKWCSIMIAAPLTDKEALRSGTWATVRYSRKAGKPVVMLSRGE